MRALAYLGIRVLVNSLKNVFRSPKRLIVATIFAAFFLVFVLRNTAYRRTVAGLVQPTLLQASGPQAEAIWTFTFVLLSFGVVAVIYTAFAEGILVFSLSEVDFLFPTPITRRTVLVTKLLRDHLKAAAWVFFFLIIVSPAVYSMTLEPMFPSIVCVWLALFLLWTSTAHLAHTVNVLTTFQFAPLRYVHSLIKLALVGIIFLVVTAVVISVRLPGAISAFRMSLIPKLLFPVQWATGLVLTPIWGITAETAPAALGLVLLSAGTFWLLLSLRQNIYEPSLAASERVASLRSAFASGGLMAHRVQVLRGRQTSSTRYASLPAFGRGAGALLWKNLIVRLRMAPLAALAVIVLPPIFVGIAARAVQGLPERGDVSWILLGEAAYLAWMLATVSLYEMKAEFRQPDTLKALPIASANAMLYTILAAAAPVVLFSLSCALSVWVFFPEANPYLIVFSLVGVPAFAIASVSAYAIVALMYPNLRDVVQGFLGFWLGLMLSSAAAVPSALIVFAGIALQAHPIVMAAALVAVNGCVTIAFAAIAGAMFRRFDPTAD